MRLRDDDDIHRARLVYLGPPNYSLPFHYTYAQYGVFFGIAFVLIVGGLLLFGTPKVIGYSLALAWVLTAGIWRFVNADQPARAVVKVLATDWKPSRDDKETKAGRLTARHITVRDRITDQNTVTTPTAGGPR